MILYRDRHSGGSRPASNSKREAVAQLNRAVRMDIKINALKMGERTVMQEALFYSFSLEQHVPDDHMLRSINRFVDLSDVRPHLEAFYSAMGRPSVDPELMVRMLIVGYCCVSGIRACETDLAA